MNQNQIEEAILNSELESEYEDKKSLMWKLRMTELLEDEYNPYDEDV
jgi:hypothetical protein